MEMDKKTRYKIRAKLIHAWYWLKSYLKNEDNNKPVRKYSEQIRALKEKRQNKSGMKG